MRQDWEALGLYDPVAPGAADRLALLEFLTAQGIPTEEMVRAARSGRLAGLVGDRQLRPGTEWLTIGELADRAGMAPEQVSRIWRACGFAEPGPDAVLFSERDLELFALFVSASELFGEAVVLQLGRVIGSATARIAEAAIASVGAHRDAPLMAAGASELEIAKASAENAEFLPLLSQTLDTLLRHHMEAVLDSRFTLAFPSAWSETADLAVGFADLVGSTALAQELPTTALALAMAEFEATALDTVTAGGGRVVKLIGDEVMYVAPDAGRGFAIALDLVEAFRAHEVLPPVRAGLAVGPVIALDGDYYGPVVSLAARVAKLALPNALLITAEVAERVRTGGPWKVSPAGRRRLKGFAEPVTLFSAAR